MSVAAVIKFHLLIVCFPSNGVWFRTWRQPMLLKTSPNPSWWTLLSFRLDRCWKTTVTQWVSMQHVCIWSVFSFYEVKLNISVFLRQGWAERSMQLVAPANHWDHGLLKEASRSAGRPVVDTDTWPVSLSLSQCHSCTCSLRAGCLSGGRAGHLLIRTLVWSKSACQLLSNILMLSLQ